MSRPVIAAFAAVATLVLAGCSSGGCGYRSGCGSEREEPTRAQAAGVHGPSIARRLPVLEREAGSRIEGLLVNRWGELWTELDGGRYVAISHDGTDVRQSGHVDESVTTDDPFPVHDVDPNAIDRALTRIARVDPGHDFVKATLVRDDFLYGGMRWEVMVGGDDEQYYATYAAAPDGSSVCRMSVFDHGKTPTPRRCPDFGHQPPGIPAP